MKNKPKDYRVAWEIDVPAKNPRDAATQALKIQRDAGSTATVFDVYSGKAKRPVRVDLNVKRVPDPGAARRRVLVELHQGLVYVYTDDPGTQVYIADWDMIADKNYCGYDRFFESKPDGDFMENYRRILTQKLDE